MTDSTVALRFENVVKDYGSTRALFGLSFEIQQREFFTLLGPSGCGKTTLLRLIAGFETVTEGRIWLNGADLSALPAAKRPVNTVFQHYALFPHLSVRDNVGFGLRMLGWRTERMNDRVELMLDMVKLSDFAGRKPGQLSGGQQQRVALARAMAPEPQVLLLDEPLSALDLKLRQAMRTELKQLQQQSGITFVFVTHDQEEALAMSDRIAVLSGGRVQQIGTPRQIYDEPVNAFVADFIGQSNVLDVEPCGSGWSIPGSEYVIETTGDAASSQSRVSVRPEQLSLSTGHDPATGWCGLVRDVSYLGSGSDVEVELLLGPRLNLTVAAQDVLGASLKVGDAVTVTVALNGARLLD